jgi:hypothetical protein
VSAPSGIPIALPPADLTRPGGQVSAPEGAERKRLWLASLEEALLREGERTGVERRSKKGVLAPCMPTAALPEALRCAANRGSEAAEPMGPDSLLGRATAGLLAGDSWEPLRFHAEWSDAGLHVWLGSDRQGENAALGAQVTALITELRRQLEVRGVRLLRVTCNGREAWAYPDVDEPPTRSISQEEP